MLCEVFAYGTRVNQYYSSFFAKAIISDLCFPFRHAPGFWQHLPFLEEGILTATHMGCPQNYGPILVIPYLAAPNISGYQIRTLIWGYFMGEMLQGAPNSRSQQWTSARQGSLCSNAVSSPAWLMLFWLGTVPCFRFEMMAPAKS